MLGQDVAWMVERLEVKNGRKCWTHTTGDLVMTRNAACHREEHHQKLGFVTRATALGRAQTPADVVGGGSKHRPVGFGQEKGGAGG